MGLVAARALLLGGDEVRVKIGIDDDCHLELVDIGGTVAYPASGLRSSWHSEITAGERSTLCWDALPFVVSGGASVARSTIVRGGTGARVLLRDTLILGRSAERGGRVESFSDVRIGGRPISVERLEADGAEPVAGVLGHHRVHDSIIAAGFRPPSSSSVLELDAPGSLARWLGTQAHHSPLTAIWRRWHAILAS